MAPKAKASPDRRQDDARARVRLPEENIVILVGRLTKDPKLFVTSGGHEVCHFRIAVNRRFLSGEEWRDDVVFVPVTAWRALAKRCAGLGKGSAVRVEGRLHGAPGREGYPPRLEVQARRVQFLERRPSQTGEETEDAEETEQPDGEQVAAQNDET